MNMLVRNDKDEPELVHIVAVDWDPLLTVQPSYPADTTSNPHTDKQTDDRDLMSQTVVYLKDPPWA